MLNMKTTESQPLHLYAMKTHPLTRCLLTAAVLAAAAQLHAQTWQTVDDFQSTVGDRAYGSDITTDPSTGFLYAVGGGDTDASGNYRLALVNVSGDQGTNWTTLTQAHEPGWTWGHYRAVAVSGNRLFVGGNGRYTDLTGEQGISWLIRESTDGGATWGTTDNLANGVDTSGCSDIAIHPNGDVYAGGSSSALGRFIRRRAVGESGFSTVFATGPSDYGSAWAIGFHPTTGAITVAGDTVNPTTGESRWIVLGSATGNPGSWKTNDTFRTGEWTGIWAGGVLVTSNTTYVSGWAHSSTTRKNQWIVRASTDGGNTWAISDNFSYGGTTPYVFGMKQDRQGNLYVCGQSANSSGKLFWIVRKGTPTTTLTKQGKKVTSIVWTTSDAYQLSSAKTAMAVGLTVDGADNVFVCGRAQDASGIEHFIVRKLAAQ
jgi:hypothetical protein